MKKTQHWTSTRIVLYRLRVMGENVINCDICTVKRQYQLTAFKESGMNAWSIGHILRSTVQRV